MTSDLRGRRDVPKEERWNLEALYPHDAAWEADCPGLPGTA